MPTARHSAAKLPARTCALALLVTAGSLRAAGTSEPLLLVVDPPAGTSDHLSRFRRMDTPFPAGTTNPPSRAGLGGLRISGSSEFSEAGLKMLRARLPVRTFTVMDLRQESHGFAGGLPVSWEANHNWANLALSPEEVRADEKRRLDALAAQDRADLVRLDSKWSRANTTLIPIRPGKTRTEEELVTAHGLSYARFTVSDHSHPNDAHTDAFVTLARRELESGWMHFHCKAGIGRTTVFMVMADMMRNARRVPRADIIRRQSLLAGYNLEAIQHPGTWSEKTSRDRRDFLYAFHDYCRTAAPSFTTPWSAYARARRARAAISPSGSATSTSAR